MLDLCGWTPNPAEVERVLSTMPTPFFMAPSPQKKDMMLHTIFKQVTGADAPNGPQKIGDCVSWGNGNAVNYTSVLEIYDQISQTATSSEHYDGLIDDARYEYQEACTEVIYALSRVDIGGERGSYQDGSVGAWAAAAVTKLGSISRQDMTKNGVDGTYSGQRAKQWGAQGIPDSVRNLLQGHLVADATPVRTFEELAYHAESLRVTAVCSNIGFENGSGGAITSRDSQGFARPAGTWPHCMLFTSVKWGNRPGALLLNQWGDNVVGGPMGDVEIPKCSWWVDADVVNRMLAQNDSFTFTKYKGYPAKELNWKF